MERGYRWTVVGAGIVIVGGVATAFLPFVGPLLAAGVAGVVIGYGLADPTDGARAGMVAGFVGGAVPGVLHVVLFVTISAHDPSTPPLHSIALRPPVLFGGLVFASILGAVSIGSAAFVGYLRKRAIA